MIVHDFMHVNGGIIRVVWCDDREKMTQCQVFICVIMVDTLYRGWML